MTEVKERPILMCGEMVRATLEKRKTQTRRVVKGQPKGDFWLPHLTRHGLFFDAQLDPPSSTPKPIQCPYGKVGDRLWVRETFHVSPPRRSRPIPYPDQYPDIKYRATDCRSSWDEGPWKPSIFCKRECSRILMEIVDVRVERVQTISEADCHAEGITIPSTPDGRVLLEMGSKYAPVKYLPQRLCDAMPSTADIARAHYASLWDGLNSGWAVDPFVWVIAFKVVEVKS